jgi:hypothetical protein
MEKQERRSLIYQGANRCTLQLEAGDDPNYYPGRECTIHYGGVESTATMGLESVAESRVIVSRVGNILTLNSPLAFDLPEGDVAEIQVK